MKHITQSTSYKAIGPYSLAVRSGNLLFCSGVIGVDQQGALADTFEGQVKNIFNGIRDVLAQEELTLNDVVKSLVFLADMNDFAKFNELYAAEFGDHRPARSTVQVARLPRDARVEIECIACTDTG